MPKIDETILNRASQAWREACHKLGVKVVAPFALEDGNSSVLCLALLPHFGGPNGMVVAPMDLPKIMPDDHIACLAKEKGLYFSHVNASAFANRKVNINVFKDTLEDWGYFGLTNECPSWFEGYKHFSDLK